MKQPTKAIILAAGLGTRFLPQTKAMPKEMLPIIDKPVIQLVVEDVIAAGVTDIIIVTGSTKPAIEDHFDRSDAMEAELHEKGTRHADDANGRVQQTFSNRRSYAGRYQRPVGITDGVRSVQ